MTSRIPLVEQPMSTPLTNRRITDELVERIVQTYKNVTMHSLYALALTDAIVKYIEQTQPNASTSRKHESLMLFASSLNREMRNALRLHWKKSNQQQGKEPTWADFSPLGLDVDIKSFCIRYRLQHSHWPPGDVVKSLQEMTEHMDRVLTACDGTHVCGKLMTWESPVTWKCSLIALSACIPVLWEKEHPLPLDRSVLLGACKRLTSPPKVAEAYYTACLERVRENTQGEPIGTESFSTKLLTTDLQKEFTPNEFHNRLRILPERLCVSLERRLSNRDDVDQRETQRSYTFEGHLASSESIVQWACVHRFPRGVVSPTLGDQIYANLRSTRSVLSPVCKPQDDKISS